MSSLAQLVFPYALPAKPVSLFFSIFFSFFIMINFSHGTAALIKKLILRKLTGVPKKIEVNPIGCSRWCGVAGDERVPPSLLSWYCYTNQA